MIWLDLCFILGWKRNFFFKIHVQQLNRLVRSPTVIVSPFKSPVDSHSCNFEHRLVIFLHEVDLVSVLSVNVLHLATKVVLLRIKVRGVCGGGDRYCGFAVVIGWENLREGISHSHLAVECSAEEGLVRVQTSVSHSMLGGWRERVV